MLDIYARIETVPKSEPIEGSIAISQSKITVHELIEKYVTSNVGFVEPLLVRPIEEELALNMQSQTERNIAHAITAFRNNGFILLVDDRQVNDLDEEVELNRQSVVTFLRLTPLVGG